MTAAPLRLDDDTAHLWRLVGTLMIRRESRIDARFDRLEGDVSTLKDDVSTLKGDVSTLKGDVSTLKTDVADSRQRLGSLERATERRFNRVDAQLGRLITLV